MSRLFGAYVLIDWSASETKKTGDQSVFIGVMKRDVRRRPTYEVFNPASRAEAETLLQSILADLRKRGDKVFIGVDFALGFPRGTVERLKAAGEKISGPNWSALWSFFAANVVDKPDNTNNRFAVAAKMNRLMTDEAYPFWGAPAKAVQRWLASTKPETYGGLPEYRLTEDTTKKLGGRKVAKSLWQMHGAGVVGGESMLGILMVRRLLEHLGPQATLWPLATGFAPLKPEDLETLDVVVAEIYPAFYSIEKEPGEAKNAAAVRAVAEALYKVDEKGEMGPLFGPPRSLSEDDLNIAATEEGWIFGAE